MKHNIDRIISESIDNIVTEKLQSDILKGAHKDADIWLKKRGWYGHNDLSHCHSRDYQAHGIVGSDGMWTDKYLDKITDDMIDFVTSEDDMYNHGFKKNKYGQIVDYEGNPRYGMALRNGKIIIFKNDEDTIEKLRELSQNAGAQWKEREDNKKYHVNDTYRWSTRDRGNAFREWKQTGALWDNPEWNKKYNIGDWRHNGSWVKKNMDDALKSYGR